MRCEQLVPPPMDALPPRESGFQRRKVLIMMAKLDHLHNVLEIFLILLSGRFITLFQPRGDVFTKQIDRARLPPWR